MAAVYDWWVYSTALADVFLMVECRLTGKRGYIPNPTREEWKAAFHAPGEPYRWTGDPSRVVVD